MAASNSSWLNPSLISSSRQPAAQHALYSSELQVASAPQQQQVDLGRDGHDPCSTFCQAEAHPRTLDYHQSPDRQQIQDFNRPTSNGCSGGIGENAPLNLEYHQLTDRTLLQDFSRPAGNSSSGRQGRNASHISARKVHKADREKLRRDKLNEQFAELAGVLDPDRPKHDKATILGDGVQVVRELRAELKRLQTEHTSLLDESRDMAQEKTELREEKATLKAETEQLQVQFQQRLRLMNPWIGVDPSLMMGAAPFGYTMQVPQPGSAPSPALQSDQASMPQSGAPPPTYAALPQAHPGSFAIPLQAYTMLGSGGVDGSTPYLPYPHYPPQVTVNSHVERPYPQYPSPMHPLPGYLLQMQPPQAQPPVSAASSETPMFQGFGPGLSTISTVPEKKSLTQVPTQEEEQVSQ